MRSLRRCFSTGLVLRRLRPRERGLTLIEVLMVVTLIALLTGTVLFGPGMLEGSRMRAAATLIVTGVRLGLTRASSSGHPTRLVFDLDEESVTLEEASNSLMLREKSADASAGAEPATSVEKKARVEAERILEGPRAPRASFKPIVALGGDTGKGITARKLGNGVEFVSVETDHDDEPRTKGRAYLYFWPGGTTERAAIQLKRHGDDQGLTVSVSALTGRAKIERGRIELPPAREDRDLEQRGEF